MTERNRRVNEELTRSYRPNTTGDLRVFCVSNEDYWQNRNLPVTVALPTLQLSGIVDARKYCIGIVADAQLRAARSFMNDKVPNLLLQVDIWVQAGAMSATAERRQAMTRVLNEVEEGLKSVSIVALS